MIRVALLIVWLLLGGTGTVVMAKPWQGIVPLHSTRADVRQILGKPIVGADGAIELYERPEGRVQVMYARKACEEGLPADWGNWKVDPGTVVNISITLNRELAVTELRVSNFKKLKWYTDKSGATYYHDRNRGVEYQVQGDIVTAITYGPAATDWRLRCKANLPLIRY